MNALGYLLRKSWKNRFIEVLHKPGKLIVYILLIAFIVALVILSQFTTHEQAEFLDPIWLKGIMFALVAIYVVIMVRKGLSSGDTIFNMNDVNFLFVSPIRAQNILIYGVSHMLSAAVLAGFFILFQSNSLKVGFNVGFSAVLILLAGFIAAELLLSIISLLIYSVTNGRPKRKLAVKIITICVFVPAIVYFVISLVQTGTPMQAVDALLRSPVFSWTPVCGWAAAAVYNLIIGQTLLGILWFCVIIAAGVAILVYFSKSNPDYYEDVLVATETAFERKRSMEEGQFNTEAISDKKIKVVRTGLRGWGADTIFYKHLRESFRANRLGLWGASSIMIVVIGLVVCFASRSIFTYAIVLPQILMWITMFTIGTGRGLKELYSHYIYMIPERSFSKILWSNLESMLKIFVESVLIFSVGGIFVGAPAPLIIACILAYTLYGALLISINYFTMRFTGISMNSGLMIILYIVFVLAALAPGLIVGIMTGVTVGGNAGMAIGYYIIAAWILIITVVLFALSRGALDNNDMPKTDVKL